MGRPKTVSDKQFVKVVREWPKNANLPSTADIRDQINDKYGHDYDRKTIYRRLSDLKSDGLIQSVEVGTGRGRSIGWVAGSYTTPMTKPQLRTTIAVIVIGGLAVATILVYDEMGTTPVLYAFVGFILFPFVLAGIELMTEVLWKLDLKHRSFK